jgi:hypothetical protein
MMETKKTESTIGSFTKEVDSLSETMLDEQKGYVLFAYGEVGKDELENSFASRGKLGHMAECIYSCMKQNPMLANIVVAASNALVQSRMLEAQISAGDEAPKETKKKRTKKIVS